MSLCESQRGLPLKRERAEHANQLLRIVASYGRRFFHDERDGAVTFFQVGSRGEVWLHDKYTKRRVYTQYEGRWRGFSEGGTLRDLCRALRDYIRAGKPISPGWFGPWPEHVCGGDLWGYGEDMDPLRREVTKLPCVGLPVPKAPTPTGFYICDLREVWRRHKYVTFWRPNNANYAWGIEWSGLYDLATVNAKGDYYLQPAGDRERFPVPAAMVRLLAVPATIDGKRVTAVRNTPRNREFLRAAAYRGAGEVRTQAEAA